MDAGGRVVFLWGGVRYREKGTHKRKHLIWVQLQLPAYSQRVLTRYHVAGSRQVWY